METLSATETTFYQDATVTVTQSRYVTNSKTYAMRNISSVHVYEIVKSKKIPIGLIIIGFFLLLVPDTRIFGAMMAGLGILLLIFIKNEYAVRISTNSGEANSIVDKDQAYIQNIVNALNEAIIHRG